MKFTLDEIRTALGLPVDSTNESSLPLRIITDSREAGPATIFWALHGETHDGHAFVESALAAGCDVAVVNAHPPSPLPPGAKGQNLLQVEDTLAAFQSLATWNRQRHATKVVGITGSLGGDAIVGTAVGGLSELPTGGFTALGGLEAVRAHTRLVRVGVDEIDIVADTTTGTLGTKRTRLEFDGALEERVSATSGAAIQRERVRANRLCVCECVCVCVSVCECIVSIF